MSDIVKQIKDAEQSKRKALAFLHVELGYESPQALASAILKAAGGAPKGAKPAAGPSTSVRAPVAKQGKGRRLSPETRAAIISALKSGVKGTEVTRRFGVSYPTVHAIKGSLGMVTSRGGKKTKKK